MPSTASRARWPRARKSNKTDGLGVASGAKRRLAAAAHCLFERDGFHGSIMHVINAQEKRLDFSGLSFGNQF
jgi:hypothetical protein